MDTVNHIREERKDNGKKFETQKTRIFTHMYVEQMGFKIRQH